MVIEIVAAILMGILLVLWVTEDIRNDRDNDDRDAPNRDRDQFD